jgi:MFS family permease
MPSHPPELPAPAVFITESGDTSTPGPPAWLPKALHAFAFREWRILWIGACTSSIGGWMQTVAQAWLIYNLTKSPFYLGLDSFLAMAPMLGFSLIGGAIADRLDRRKLLIFSQCIQLVTAFILAALLATDTVRVWHILTLSFVTGSAQAIGGPAYMALMPNLVPKEYVPNAVSLNSIQFNLARIIGPAFAGVAMAKYGPTMCFFLNGLSFLAVIASLVIIRAPQVIGRSAGSLIGGIKQGFAVIFKDSALWQLCLLAFVNTGLGIAVPTLMPEFAKEVFKGDAALYSRLVSWSGVGAVVGALVVASFSKRMQRGSVIVMAQMAFGASMVLFALSNSLWLSFIWLFCAGSLLVSVYALITSLFQALLTDELRGRLISIYMVGFRGGMALGGLLAGTLAHYFSPTKTVVFNGFLLIALAGLLFAGRAKLLSIGKDDKSFAPDARKAAA